MPGLDELLSVSINGQQRGAYMEPLFFVEGLATPVGLSELLQYILSNLGSGGGGLDRYVNAANLTGGNNLELTLSNGSTVQVDLSTLATDEDDFVSGAALQGNNLVITLDSGATVSADLSALSGGGSGISVYTNNGWVIKGTAGITVTSGSQGVYDLNVPAGGILDSFERYFTNPATEMTVGGEVVVNIDWNTIAFNTSRADAKLPAFTLTDAAGTQRDPLSVAVTPQTTSVAGGQSSTTLANINGVGNVTVKGVL